VLVGTKAEKQRKNNKQQKQTKNIQNTNPNTKGVWGKRVCVVVRGFSAKKNMRVRGAIKESRAGERGGRTGRAKRWGGTTVSGMLLIKTDQTGRREGKW
jgi:hypothetical protein